MQHHEADSYFWNGFRVAPSDIGINSAQVTVIEISCKGNWVVPGSTLIVKSSDRLLTSWDGVFFELTLDK
jgi:hypothetical protein